MEFREFTSTEVTIWITKVESRTVACSGAQFGSVVVMKLQAIKDWVKKYVKHGKVPTVAGFDAQAFVK